MKVNPDEAPEGYVARFSDTGFCNGCYFFGDGSCAEKNEISCQKQRRKDGCEVVFVKIECQPKFKNYALRKIAEECGFTVYKDNIEEFMNEIEVFASEVFKDGVEYGKELANQGEVH